MEATHPNEAPEQPHTEPLSNLVKLEGRTYNCKFCKTNLALAEDVLSKAFHCRSGKAYLFNNVVNITLGPHEERMTITGMYTVADTFCCCCRENVGWKYEVAQEKTQKYKEGKVVLERESITHGVDSTSESGSDTSPRLNHADKIMHRIYSLEI